MLTQINIYVGSIFEIFSADGIAKILDAVTPWHYVLLFAFIFAESGILIGMFFPGDSLLFTMGLFAAAGTEKYSFNLNIWILLPLFFIAAFTGDQAGYFIGNKAGDRYFKKENAKILKPSHVIKTHEFFEKHGPKTILLARFVPIVRTIAPIMAGTGKMRYKTFVIYNAVGALIWGVGITLLGYFLGDLIGEENVDKYLLPIIIGIIVVSFIPPYFEYRKSKKEKNDDAESVTAA